MAAPRLQGLGRRRHVRGGRHRLVRVRRAVAGRRDRHPHCLHRLFAPPLRRPPAKTRHPARRRRPHRLHHHLARLVRRARLARPRNRRAGAHLHGQPAGVHAPRPGFHRRLPAAVLRPSRRVRRVGHGRGIDACGAFFGMDLQACLHDGRAGAAAAPRRRGWAGGCGHGRGQWPARGLHRLHLRRVDSHRPADAVSRAAPLVRRGHAPQARHRLVGVRHGHIRLDEVHNHMRGHHRRAERAGVLGARYPLFGAAWSDLRRPLPRALYRPVYRRRHHSCGRANRRTDSLRAEHRGKRRHRLCGGQYHQPAPHAKLGERAPDHHAGCHTRGRCARRGGGHVAVHPHRGGAAGDIRCVLRGAHRQEAGHAGRGAVPHAHAGQNAAYPRSRARETSCGRGTW